MASVQACRHSTARFHPRRVGPRDCGRPHGSCETDTSSWRRIRKKEPGQRASRPASRLAIVRLPLQQVNRLEPFRPDAIAL